MMYRAIWVRQPLDIDYLNLAASQLVGEHDFASFCKVKSQNGSTTRYIEKAEFTRNETMVTFTIRGNAFLHNMIRIIIGTLVSMNVDGEPADKIKSLLEIRDRNMSGVTAPPYGLYLNSIIYKPSLVELNKKYNS